MVFCIVVFFESLVPVLDYEWAKCSNEQTARGAWVRSLDLSSCIACTYAHNIAMMASWGCQVITHSIYVYINSMNGPWSSGVWQLKESVADLWTVHQRAKIISFELEGWRGFWRCTNFQDHLSALAASGINMHMLPMLLSSKVAEELFKALWGHQMIEFIWILDSSVRSRERSIL